MSSARESHNREIKKIVGNLHKDFTDGLLKLSSKYLEMYYAQINQQANNSFKVVMVFSIISGMVLLAGIIGVLFFDLKHEAYISIGAGVITQFITSIFFVLYNKTVNGMSKYHKRLLMSQNLAIALKAAERMIKDDCSETVGRICDAIIKDYNVYLIECSSLDDVDLPVSGKPPQNTAEK